LFIYPDFLEATKYVRNIPGNYNEGLASLSAVLKEAGHNVSLYHLTYMPEKDEFLGKVRAFSPDMIGMSIRTSALGFSAEMAGWLDDELGDIFVMAGMYHASLAPQEVIDIRGIDAVCMGEGEFVCREFVDYYAEHKKPNLNNDSFWIKDDDGTIHKNPIRDYVENLDSLPFPDLDLFDYRNLRSNFSQNTAEVILGRGCVYSCTYCANAQLRNIYPNKKNYTRFRSPENSIKLLERVLEKDPKIQYFSFNDAILNVFEDWFYAFTALYKEKIKKKYVCNLRFDLLDEKMIKELADSGCYLVTIGLEIGNEEYRKKYLYRTMDNDHIVNVSRLLKKYGIIVNSYNIIGLPYETLPLTLETIKLNARMHTDNVVISFFQPYPSTQLRVFAEEGGLLHPDTDPHDPIQLRMPDYPRHDIFYARYSFMKLMKQYRKLYAAYEGNQLEQKINRLDGKILRKNHPRRLIGAFRKHAHSFEVFSKRTASRYLPAVYKLLRKARDKMRAKV
jgi:radical SAM superfamily enzyme YgiQ (UPF0313 family)